MRPIIILVSLLVFFINARAQYIVNGKITDKQGAGIAFATIVLLKLPDSAIIVATLSDSNGNYQLEARQLKNTIVTATVAGYATLTQMVVSPEKLQTINLSLAKETIELSSVSVSARKPLIERKVDRIVFNVENSITALGGDALDAIGKAPGVKVSGDEDISLAGKSTVSLMIDDKLIQLGGEELAGMLHSIPSDNIARIEVITTPPAKYDAAGNSGIINIVTKKQKKEGLNGNIGVEYRRNYYSVVQPTGTFNYRKGKWNIYGNTNGGENYSRPVEKLTANYPGQRLEQQDVVDNLHNYHRSQLGADYNISANAVLGMLYTFGGSTPKRWEHINSSWLGPGNVLDSTVFTHAHTADFGERHVGNLNYEWKIDSSGKKLNVDADFFTRAGRTVRDMTTNDVLDNGTPTGVTSVNKSTGKQVLYISSVKADMELPLRIAKISFGAKASTIHVISDNVFQYLDSTTYITDQGKTNKFDYRETTAALYISAQKKVHAKWDVQAGLRGEYTQTRAASATVVQTTERKYFQLFPTAYVQYLPNENNSFNLNYSRRIDRPNMSMINPFRRYLTLNSYDEGNPFLQPSFSSNFEFSYTLKSNYNFTLFSQHTQQVATQILDVDQTSKEFHFTYANIGSSLNYGISASATLQPFEWWECSIQAYGFQATVSADYYNSGFTNRYARTAFIAENNNTFILNNKKTLLAEIGVEYNGKMIENYELHLPNANVTAGVKALFFKKDLVLGISVNDIFATEVIRVTNMYNGAATNNYYDARCLNINLMYKFGNKGVRSKRDRAGGAVEESRRS